eukprot:gene9572-biopygen6209
MRRGGLLQIALYCSAHRKLEKPENLPGFFSVPGHGGKWKGKGDCTVQWWAGAVHRTDDDPAGGGGGRRCKNMNPSLTVVDGIARAHPMPELAPRRGDAQWT